MHGVWVSRRPLAHGCPGLVVGVCADAWGHTAVASLNICLPVGRKSVWQPGCSKLDVASCCVARGASLGRSPQHTQPLHPLRATFVCDKCFYLPLPLRLDMVTSTTLDELLGVSRSWSAPATVFLPGRQRCRRSPTYNRTLCSSLAVGSFAAQVVGVHRFRISGRMI